ncbi:phosphatase PAP2 family protein [Sphaerisporangium aureirubrum]|uniref:Phosphatase PAP2 family protein n=1 Tax=Sphaerisporangium aureirubrum TaxID=1544736 RepID=A0ABW1NTF5_9ACTN
MAVPFTVLVVLVTTSFPPLYQLDRGVAATLHAWALDHPGWVTLLDLWTDVFSPESWRAAVALAVLWLVYRGAPRLAAWAVTTMVAGGLLGLGLKFVVDRARPHLPDPIAVAPGASFPSGHALNATIGAGVLILLVLPHLSRRARTLLWCAGAVVVVGVAYTRVALVVHWVSDVVGGVILGIAVVTATTAAFETWRRDSGRRPVEPHLEGVEPEAEEQTAPEGKAHDDR